MTWTVFDLSHQKLMIDLRKRILSNECAYVGFLKEQQCASCARFNIWDKDVCWQFFETKLVDNFMLESLSDSLWGSESVSQWIFYYHCRKVSVSISKWYLLSPHCHKL